MSSVLHTDQLGRKVEISFPPKRIVSIVPSQTELLHHLGLHEEVVGITKFCIHSIARGLKSNHFSSYIFKRLTIIIFVNFV